MIQQSGRFATSKIYRQALIQETCPVHVHCSRLCTDVRTGDKFLQIRLVNRSDRQVDHVFLRAEGLDPWGNPCGVLDGLVLPDCRAQGHSIFGEDRMISVGKLRASNLNITVQAVSFSDGMRWRCTAADLPQAMEETDWELCACGLPNSPKHELCDLCRRPLKSVTPAPSVTEPKLPDCSCPEPEMPVSLELSIPESRPAPIRRSEEELVFNLRDSGYPELYDEEEEDDEEGVPRWLFILLCVIGGLALMAAVVFLVYFLKNTDII